MIRQLILVPSSNIKAEEYDTVMFRRLIDINVTGAFLVAQACGQQMIKQGTGGSIVFIASMSGSIVNYPQGQCCYNASKAAVVQLGKSLAAEWAPYGIRVNMISPGYMDTALNRVPALEAQKKIWTTMTPMNRLGNVDELNNLAVFLASDASSLMTGANCIIDVSRSINHGGVNANNNNREATRCGRKGTNTSIHSNSKTFSFTLGFRCYRDFRSVMVLIRSDEENNFPCPT